MVRKNLIVSLDEASSGGDQSIFSIRTTMGNAVVVECTSLKLALNPIEMKEALLEIEKFLDNRKLDVLVDKIQNSIPYVTYEEQD